MPDIPAALAQIAAARALLDDASAILTAEPPAPEPEPEAIFLYVDEITQPIEVAPAPDLALTAARVAFRFITSNFDATQGLFSRDASGLAPDGGHVAVWIANGRLNVRMQDALTSQEVESIPIASGVEYAVELVFGPAGWRLSVDGQQLAMGDLAVSWETTQNHIQFGALGWASAEGSPGWTAPLQGTMRDMLIDAVAFEEPAPDPEPAPEPEAEPETEPDPEPEHGVMYVAGDSDLAAALAAASGGGAIILAPGTYSEISLTHSYGDGLVIRSGTRHAAIVGVLNIPGGSNIRLEGLQVQNMPRADGGAHQITYIDNLFTNGVYFRDASQVTMIGNEVIGNVNGVILNNVSYFELKENVIRDAVSDLLRVTGDSHHGLIENNTLHDVHAVRPHHPDMIQMFAVGGITPRNITIRGNHLYDDPGTGDVYGQGIFLSDPAGDGYSDILIEQNLINVGSPNSIYINGGTSDVVVQDNSLIPWPMPGDGGAFIRLASKSGLGNAGTTVVRNVCKAINDETSDSALSANYEYGAGAAPNLFSGAGGKWQDFLPVEGSPIDFGSGYGALQRLMDLRS